jgi:predicted aspartyl protease
MLVTIGGKQGIALVDTGSSHTLMDLKFSTKINCTTTTTKSLEAVLVAGGGKLQTGATI